MKLRFQALLLALGAMVCFVEVFAAPKGSDPGPWAAAILGVVLLRRAIITAPQPHVVIAAGWLLTLLLLAGDHGLLSVNSPAWLVLIILAGICYAFWEKLQRLWA